jgi:hypothetical protein
MTSTSLPLFDTREAAHVQVRPTKQDTYARILAYADLRGRRGFTADEATADFGCSHNHVAPRITEPSDAGELVLTGERRRTRSNCLARVFVARQFAALAGTFPEFGCLASEGRYPD